MRLFVKQVEGLVIPKQAKPFDAGYDVVATSPPNIVGTKLMRTLDYPEVYSRIAYIEYGTNLFVEPEEEDIVFWGHLEGAGNGGAIDWTNIGIKYHTQLWPRSSVSKTNMVLANSIGLVDYGYRNQIMCRFKYIFQPEDMLVVPEATGMKVYGTVNQQYIYQQGDAMVQIVGCPNVEIKFETVKELGKSARGMGGFGSTGK